MTPEKDLLSINLISLQSEIALLRKKFEFTLAENSMAFMRCGINDGEAIKRIEKLENNNSSSQQSFDIVMATIEKLAAKETLWDKQINERLEKLEGYMGIEDRVSASDVLNRLSQLEDRCSHNNGIVCQELSNLESKFDEVCKNFDANRVIINREPHKCPVCEGLTLLSNKYIEKITGEKTNLPPAICKACKGEGVLWG